MRSEVRSRGADGRGRRCRLLHGARARVHPHRDPRVDTVTKRERERGPAAESRAWDRVRVTTTAPRSRSVCLFTRTTIGAERNGADSRTAVIARGAPTRGASLLHTSADDPRLHAVSCTTSDRTRKSVPPTSSTRCDGLALPPPGRFAYFPYFPSAALVSHRVVWSSTFHAYALAPSSTALELQPNGSAREVLGW